MRNLAIIPARSGSKGLPDKNIIDLNGKPLVYHTIQAAIASGCFDEVMVSTDSEKYAEIARNCGAAVPFLRSEIMSSDTAGSWDAVREVLSNYQKIGQIFDYITLLQPTSPLRTAEDIRGLFQLLAKEDVHNVVSVTEVDHPVQWCFRMRNNNSMEEMATSQYTYTRRQELDTYYRENGAIYTVDARKIMDPSYNFYADACHGYIMDRRNSIDIDSEIDLLIARVYMGMR